MNAIATAIVPICLLLVLGYIARRTQFLPDSFWQPAEKATYYVLFPLLLINELAHAEFVRVHKSFVINLEHIKEYVRGEGGTVILSNGHQVEVSRRKKEVFMNRMKEFYKY